MINKKRGILLGNVTNIIIAVLGLMVFGFFVMKIYTLYTNQESQNAKTLVNVLEEKINLLEPGEQSSFISQGFQQKEYQWVLASWSKAHGESEGKPEKCFGKSCLCICPAQKDSINFDIVNLGDGLASIQIIKDTASKLTLGERCQKVGICRDFDADKVQTGSLGNFAINNFYIGIPENVMDLYISKEKDGNVLIATSPIVIDELKDKENTPNTEPYTYETTTPDIGDVARAGP